MSFLPTLFGPRLLCACGQESPSLTTFLTKCNWLNIVFLCNSIFDHTNFGKYNRKFTFKQIFGFLFITDLRILYNKKVTFESTFICLVFKMNCRSFPKFAMTNFRLILEYLCKRKGAEIFAQLKN